MEVKAVLLGLSVYVLNNFLLKQVFKKPKDSGRLMKWTRELSKFDIVLKARTTIKGQILVDFVAKFANVLEMEEVLESTKPFT